MRIDRLHILHDMLLEIAQDEKARQHFRLESWVSRKYEYGYIDVAPNDRKPVVQVKDDGCVQVEPATCGYAACAIGWATTLSVFQREGFCAFAGHGSIIPVFHGPHGRHSNWGAVRAFFDLSYMQAQHLFSDASYWEAGPEQVAGRIRDLIECADNDELTCA